MARPELLVGIARDGDPERVVAAARDVAARWGADLVVMHVIPLWPNLHEDVVLNPDAHPRAAAVLAEQQDVAVGWLSGLLAAVPGATGLVAHGDPADVLVAVAAQRGVAAILVGTHAREGLVRALLGSVAERVVRHASVPVVTVNSLSVRGEAPDGPAAWPTRVVGA